MLDGSSLLAKTPRKHEDAKGSCIIMTSDLEAIAFSSSAPYARSYVAFLLALISIMSTIHDKRHDYIDPLRENPFYPDVPSVI